MLRFLAKFLCILAVLAELGLFTGAQQVSAWYNMLQRDIPIMGITEALSDTLDGTSSCPSCVQIAEQKQEDHSEQTTLTSQKDPLPHVHSSTSQLPVLAHLDRLPNLHFPIPSPTLESIFTSPPTPPPQ